MYADSHDFVKYKDDFYLGGLSGEAKMATVHSMDALRDFAMNTDGCRRAALLNFFDEVPSFGKHCGTCDLCLDRKHHGDDRTRDFQWEGARVILCAVAYCPSQVCRLNHHAFINFSYSFLTIIINAIACFRR